VRTDCGGAAPLRCHCRADRTGRRRRSQHPCVACQTRIAEPYTVHPHRRLATTERRFSPTRFIRRHAAVLPALGLASAADKPYSLKVVMHDHALNK